MVVHKCNQPAKPAETRESLHFQFWLATPAKSTELQLFELPFPLTGLVESGASQPSWSPNGEYIAYLGDVQPDPTRYYGTMLRAANFHGEFLAWLPVDWERGISSLYGISSPTWSPDGKSIAYFCADCSDGSTGIWTVGESSAPALFLSRPNAPWMSCAWSPSGDAIAFVEGSSLWLATVEPRSVRLLKAGIDSNPSWSPDGNSLVFSYQGDLWVIDIETSALRQLTWHLAINRDPAWSPSGRWIAFSSNRGGHYDLWVMPASGGGAIPLMADEPDDDQPVWSPSGDRIAFRSSPSRDDPDHNRWQAQIWIASQLPDVLTEAVPRSWSTLKSSFR